MLHMPTNTTWSKILIFLVGFVIGVIFSYNEITGKILPNLSILAKIAEIITAFSVLIAAIAFIYQIQKDSIDAATEELSFFREKFVPAAKKFDQNLRTFLKIDEGTMLPTFNKITDFNLEWIRKNMRDIADEQLIPLKNNSDLPSELVNITNMLETFSQEIIHKKTINHPVLIAARALYVKFVEVNAAYICTLMYLNKDTYRGIKTVYDTWKDKIDRDTLEQKIEKTKKRLEKEK